MAKNKDKDTIDFLRLENSMLRNRVDELESLCEEKDNAAKSLISELFRSGSSMGGEEMAARKKYLHEQDQDDDNS